MANIGVIVLDTAKICAQPKLCSTRLQIEDNIGEAIHIHWRNLRLDFTIRDFLSLAKVCEEAKKNIDAHTHRISKATSTKDKTNESPKINLPKINWPAGNNLEIQLDPIFVRAMGKHAEHIKGVQIVGMSLDDLQCINILSKNPYKWEPIPVVNCKPYKCLQGDTEGYRQYAALFGEMSHNLENLYQLKKSIETHGYPHNNNMIVLFGDKPYIRDGQHRAAALRYLYGNIKVPVSRILFEDNYDDWRMNPNENRYPISESGTISSHQQQIPKTKVKDILWLRTDSIGDNVLAASMLPHIRENYSNARITVVCQEHIAKLYEACPHVDNIIAFNKGRFLQNEQYFEVIMNSLRTLKADLSLHSVYSRELAGDLLAIMCDARQRIALKGDTHNILAKQKDKLDQLYTMLLPSRGKHKLEIDRHRDFLRGLSIDAPSLKPMIWTTVEDEEFAGKFFEKNSFKPEHTIALFAGAQQQQRLYDKYGESLSEFCKKNHLSVIALGAESDRDINQKNLDQIGVKTVNLSGKTTIRQVAAILKRSRLAVGAETGLAHISCAVGTPNVILLGGGHFGRFMPYSPLTSIVCLPLKCYGCNWGCRCLYSHCVKGIKPEVVTEALRQTFAKPSEKTRVFVQGESLWEPNPWQPAWSSFEEHLNIDTVEIIPVPPESPQQRLDGLDHIAHVLSEQLRPDAQQISADALAHPSKSTQVMTNPLEEM